MILKLFTPQRELCFFLKVTVKCLLKLLPLKPCKARAVRSAVNTLRSGQGLSALNTQETKRKKTKLAAGKNTLGACKYFFTVSHACHRFGAAGEGFTRTSPPISLSLREWKCISSPALEPHAPTQGLQDRAEHQRRFLLQGRCQPAEKEEIMEPARFPALPATSPSNHRNEGKLRAINTANAYSKLL